MSWDRHLILMVSAFGWKIIYLCPVSNPHPQEHLMLGVYEDAIVGFQGTYKACGIYAIVVCMPGGLGWCRPWGKYPIKEAKMPAKSTVFPFLNWIFISPHSSPLLSSQQSGKCHRQREQQKALEGWGNTVASIRQIVKWFRMITERLEIVAARITLCL